VQDLGVFGVGEDNAHEFAVAADGLGLSLVVGLLQHGHLRFDSLHHFRVDLFLEVLVGFGGVVAIGGVADEAHLDVWLRGRGVVGLGFEALDFGGEAAGHAHVVGLELLLGGRVVAAWTRLAARHIEYRTLEC